MMLKLVLGTN